MKTKANFLKRVAAVTLSLMFVSTALFADGEANEVFLSGTTNTAAGDYVVTGTDDIYHFQGEEYEVFNVYYDNLKLILFSTDFSPCTGCPAC